jgi:hypothetical protein
MTSADLAEITRLLADYRAEMAQKYKRHVPDRRAKLETELVRHVDALIAAAECALALKTSGYLPDEEQAPYVAAPPA